MLAHYGNLVSFRSKLSGMISKKEDESLFISAEKILVESAVFQLNLSFFKNILNTYLGK